MPKQDRWIQNASRNSTKGALHRQLGIPPTEKIPTQLLRDVVNTDIGKHTHGVKVTHLLKSRSNYALNVRHRK